MQPPVGVRQRPEQEVAQPARCREPVVALEPVAGLGERGEHEPVPRGERLVVAERLRPRRAHGERARLELRVELAADDEASVLERLEQRLRDPDRSGLLPRPRVREPLDAVGVRVLGRGEPPARDGQLAEDVLDRLLDDAAIARRARDHPGVEVRRDEDGVVVQHLLEVRDEPAVVDGVAVEAAADDVVHASRRHAVERRARHRERLVVSGAQEELDRGRRRELRRVTEAAEGGLECARDAADRLREQPFGERLARGRSLGDAPERGVDPLGLPLDVAASLAPRGRHGLENVPEARDAVPGLRRVVRPRVERPALPGS